MHISDIFAKQRRTFSFEFFPPKSPDAAAALFDAIRELEPLKPSFVSVTYGAGGSTRELTHDLVVRLKQETSLEAVPHLTCVGHTEPEITGILNRYRQVGISNVLALGGDIPKSLAAAGFDRSKDTFRYATDLVRHIRSLNNGGSSPLGICVAGYPEGHPGTPNRVREIELLKAKVDAGADCIVTQLFFDNRDYLDYRERCRLAGIKVPIVAGIMPIVSIKGMHAMADMALGCRFPAALLRMVARAGDNPEAVRRVGLHWATQQCADLIDQEADGIHFYTLNKSTATREVYANLGVTDSTALRS